MEEVINGILIREVETKNIMTKSSLPVGGYSVNPYVGCTHACKYCYASFMKRFTGHKEEWGTFLDVKHWPEIKNPKKYAGQRVVIGSVTDGYNPQEEQFGNTRKLLEQLIGSDADILICTKSDLVVRDIDLLKKLGRVTVSWSINTLDENFKNDMDSASSIERRISAMKQVYEAGIRTVCFVSPVFPGITDFEAIFERVKDQCDLFWLENLNLRGGFKKTIMDYIAGKYPDLVPLYDEIYNKHNRSYFEALEVKAAEMAKKYDCAFVDNEMPYGRVPHHAAVTGTDDKDVFCLLVHRHGHMHDHLVIDEFVALGQHHIAVQCEHPAKLRRFKNIDALVIALLGVELFVHPDAVLHVRGVKLRKPKFHLHSLLMPERSAARCPGPRGRSCCSPWPWRTRCSSKFPW